MKLTAVLKFTLLIIYPFVNKFVHADTSIVGIDINKNENLMLGLPANLNNTNEVIMSRLQYALSWNSQTRNLNWSTWKLNAKWIGNSGRSDSFYVDEDLAKYLQENGGSAVKKSDYNDSCLDRGHMTPSGDRTRTKTDNKFTFYMSNIIPQATFVNKVMWENLESFSRNTTKTGKDLYIIAGPIYDYNINYIGPRHDIAVPTSVFKIIVQIPSNGSLKDINVNTPMIVVDIPNFTTKGTDPVLDHQTACSDSKNGNLSKYKKDWRLFKTTIANIEQKTGYKFLTNVDNKISNILKNQTNPAEPSF